MTDQPFSFGDATPEDAWDASDPRDVLIRNLARRIALLDGGDVVARLDVLADRLADWLATPGRPRDADAERARLASEDLEWLGARRGR